MRTPVVVPTPSVMAGKAAKGEAVVADRRQGKMTAIFENIFG